MPKLNLRDEGFEEESNPLDSDQSVAPPPTLREVGVSGGGGKSSTLLTAILLLVVVAGGVFALNYFKVIHLWGKRTPKITNEAISDQLPPPESPSSGASTDQGANPAPAEATPTPEPNVEPSATAAPPVSTPAATAPAPSRSSRAAEQAPKFVPPPSGSGSYTVQVSSWTSKDAADREASRLSAAGMSAFVEDAVIAGENWYRVRVGRYGSSKEAKQAADQLATSMEGQIWVAKVSAK